MVINKSPLQYIGGKSKLAPKIIGMIPEHTTYCEIFAGAAWVFFGKEPSRYEIINDLDSDLITFYRVLQNHLEEFLRQFKWMLASREWWSDWNRQQEAGGLTDIQRAARYYYIQRLSWGGKVKGRTFGASLNSPPRINLLRIEEEMSAIYLRLARVTIENLPWDDAVRRYDSPETFFFLDPPYFKAPFYKHNLVTIEDYERIAQILSEIKGKFLLSINDLPEMRLVFKAFRIHPVNLIYSTGNRHASRVGRKAKRAGELLITNYEARG